MKRMIGVVVLLAATASAQSPVARVAEDARVIDRVAEVSRRDLPTDLLKRLITEDIDLLRGKRPDGSYEYATFERFEASRATQSFSIQPRKDKMDTVEMKGTWIYRAIVDVPRRRLVVGRNRPVWIERVDIDFVPERATAAERQSIEVKAWMQPGEIKPIDLPAVARQATVRVIATAEEKHGYGNIDVSLISAKIVDRSDSPYADAVASAKAVQRALENNDVKSLRAMAQRLADSLGGSRVAPPTSAASTVDVVATRDPASQLELQTELQLIEDLLTGNESERREGLDRLHQLIRKTRR